jgi:hypothetical protein
MFKKGLKTNDFSLLLQALEYNEAGYSIVTKGDLFQTMIIIQKTP